MSEINTDKAPPGAADPATEPEKKKKKRYSKRLKGLQKIERGVSKAMHRLASSVDEGLRVWRKSSDRSAREKRDGAIRDALKNYAKAMGKQIRIASWAPADLARAVPEISPRRLLARIFLPIYK
jgi:hypothetical protein